MKLIVISSPEPVADEPKRINQLFGAGLEYFHLRKPHYPKEQIRQLLLQLEPEHYPKIALHQHHELAGEFGIKRLHFSEEKRSITPAAELLKLKSEGYNLSTSVHSTKVLRQLSTCFLYTFFGPVFNSISKPGYAAAVPVGFCLTATDKKVQVIALGGIDAENISLLPQMKFNGAALLGSIWSSPDQAIETFTKIKKRCQTRAHTY